MTELYNEVLRLINDYRGLDAGEQTAATPQLAMDICALASSCRNSRPAQAHDEPGEPKLSKAEHRAALAGEALVA